MKFSVTKSDLQGRVRVPGSKSHTIRAVLIASLADGESILKSPLQSSDTDAVIDVYGALGAKFDTSSEDEWKVQGIGSDLSKVKLAPGTVLDTLNSGTTLRMALGTCALLPQGSEVILTGDDQIQRRPAGPLGVSLCDLGADVKPVKDNGCPPLMIRGGLKGGETTIECKTSQYLSSLLLCCPLAEQDTKIKVPLLYEKPYVQMTMDWLIKQGIKFECNDEMSELFVPGRQSFKPFVGDIPADFSTASFFLVAGCLGNNEIILDGLDLTDSQGDKDVIEYLRTMGASIVVQEDGSIKISASKLKGADIDMNATPDALPIMALAGCFAEGTTRLLNVPQARIKETDRIAVMAQELTKMGAKVEELEDGLVIHESVLSAAEVKGHHDHRIVMSLAIAGMMCDGETTVDTAEAASVTFPKFKEFMTKLGGSIR